LARCKYPQDEFNAAQRRIALTGAYLKVVCPGINQSTRTKLADSILSLIDGKNPSVQRKQITDAQAVEMVWRHSQCVLNQTGKCPLLVFGKQLAEEINEFFREDE
jgi:hypothetical protein